MNYKIKAGKKVIDSSARCITCNKTCSMSGLCMKPWPEFTVRQREETVDGNENETENSKN
jgi:hypothetical protein